MAGPAVLGVHLFETALYAVPIGAVPWFSSWLIPFVLVPVLVLLYWLPSTELCGPHTTRAFQSSRRFLDIYRDPASRHWVVPPSGVRPLHSRSALDGRNNRQSVSH
ncbi:hypothetical protein SAMN05421812_105390 [Asanoa hainanensis]|uniref:Uncharacterized protein n=1 Tax=Asanoa hainanensis TaxID=560556 RepID=A0A239MEG2_9ACTN|nr:hypothetical protein [Asanoa hainanensis]SNT41051.1 hypothetical protein SAMN05421812_105390 [Asanoa hainanensis]